MNAVPSLVDFKNNKDAFRESRNVKLTNANIAITFDEGDFQF
jgi:hypothetical protein